MKCRHCGNNVLGDAKYCTLCGNPVNSNKKTVTRTVVDNPIENMNNGRNNGRKLYYDDSTVNNNGRGYHGTVGSNYSNKSNVGCLIAFFVVFFIPFISIFVGVFSLIGSFKTEAFVDFGEDMIPTVYEALGEGLDVCSYSSSSDGIEKELVVEYCSSDTDEYDEQFKEYVDYLIENNDFLVLDTFSDDMIVLRKESDDSGLEIVIEIDYEHNIITYDKRYISE